MEPLSFILYNNNQNIITNKYAWNMSIKYQMFNHINIYFLDTILTLGISQTPYTCMLLVGHMRWLLWTFFVGIGQCSHMWRLSRQTPLYWGSWTLWSSPLGLYLGMIILPAGTGPCRAAEGGNQMFCSSSSASFTLLRVLYVLFFTETHHSTLL